jgi:hypothetical protein
MAAAEAYVALDEDYGSLPFGDSRLAELFDCLNDKYFGGELPPIQVRVGIPWEADEWRGTNGLARFDRTQLLPKPGGNIKIYLASFLFSFPFGDDTLRWRLVAETLVHEMVKVAVFLNSPNEHVSFNGENPLPIFAEELRIGLPPGDPNEVLVDIHCETDDWPNDEVVSKYGQLLDPLILSSFASPQEER